MLTATIVANLDGINRHLACPSARDPQAKPILKILDEALRVLEDDIKVLVEAIRQQFVYCFATAKRGTEMKAIILPLRPYSRS